MANNSTVIYPEGHYSYLEVGLKAENLKPYLQFTPLYLTCSSSLYENWQIEGDGALKNNNDALTEIVKYFQKKKIKKIIVRSSCTSESISDRGRYLSSICDSTMLDFRRTILEIFNDFNQSISNSNAKIALIIQEYKVPRLQGHLSNERRISHDKDSWQTERQNPGEKSVVVESIQVKEIVAELDHSITKCLNARTLKTCLQTTASWFTKFEDRYHIEWLWDGKNFWILQIDRENTLIKGSKPGSEWIRERKKVEKKDVDILTSWIPKVFETIDSSVYNWHKIECLKTFSKCQLPYWDIYILENDFVLDQLSKGIVDISLKSDLHRLLSKPITIRTDKLSSREVLLNRSDTIFNYDDAEKFLIKTAKSLIKKGLSPNQFCFLIHQFIISKAGALCFAKPNLERVRADSTWGIVEGLYYHPHDSFEVLLNERKIKRKLRCKYKYIDVNLNGSWYSKPAGYNYDWKQSISDAQLYKIANQTQKIADYLDLPVTVMFFINDPKGPYPEILPWYYSIDEIPDKNTSYTEVIFSERKDLISSKNDFKKLKEYFTQSPKRPKNRIILNLDTEILRDKKFIEDIGDFAVKKGIVVELEGSILSHPYYVLHSKGVDVRCVNPLELTYNHKEFYKLVRDKIPVKIEDNHETVISTKVSPKQLVDLLKEKVVEEAFEMYWSSDNDHLIEEVADILEVLRGTCKAYGIDFSEIENIANKKREKRGGFEEGVVLIASRENSLFQLVEQGKNLFNLSDEENIPVKLNPVLNFFQLGEVNNFKSLTEVNQVRIPYINNYSSKSNNFRYLIKQDRYNALCIEYRDKEILITLESLDNLAHDPDQLKIFS